MKSSTCERLAVLPAIMDVLHINEDAVVEEYLRRTSASDWDEVECVEAFLWLEREIAEAEGYESESDSDDGDNE